METHENGSGERMHSSYEQVSDIPTSESTERKPTDKTTTGPRPKGIPIKAALDALADSWDRPDAFVSTGLHQLDEMLSDGLRAGEMLGVTGSAGGGKSIFVGQIALDAALAGAIVIYASVEMPASEVTSRWLAREMFTKANQGGTDWPAGYSDIMYGNAYRLGYESSSVSARLDAAQKRLDSIGDRLVIAQLEPGSTVQDLRMLVEDTVKAVGKKPAIAHGEKKQDLPVILVVDPLQRLFASVSGARSGRACEAVNANETERVGAVAQELKYLADTTGLAVLFTSDTTKAAALGAMSSAGSFRSSYQINHLATVVFGLHSANTPKELRSRLDGPKSKNGEQDPLVPEMTVEAIDKLLPSWWSNCRRDAEKLGARVAVLECSKNRRGPPRPLAFGIIPGAACVVEAEKK